MSRTPLDEDVREGRFWKMPQKELHRLWDRCEKMQDAPLEEKDVVYYLGRGSYLIGAKDFPGAELVIREGVGRFPNEKELWLHLASIQWQRGDFAGAGVSFQHAANLDPQDALAWKGVGSSLIAIKQFKQALDPLRHAVELAPRREGVWNLLGQVYLNLKEKNKAIQSLQQAVDIEPDNIELLENLGATAFSFGMDSNPPNGRVLTIAASAYSRLHQLKGDDIDAVRNLAAIYIALEDYQNAGKMFSIIVMRVPADLTSWQSLIECYSKLGKLMKAIETCGRAQKIHVGNKDLEAYLADLQAQVAREQFTSLEKVARERLVAKDFTGAAKAYKKCLEIHDTPALWEEYGDLCTRCQEWGVALKAYEKGFQDDTLRTPAFYFKLARVHAHLNDLNAVHVAMGKVGENSGPDAFSWTALAELLIMDQNYPAALEILQQGILKTPNNLPLLLLIIKCQEKVGNQTAAVETCKQAMQIPPQDFQSWMQIGLFWLRLGNFNYAATVFQNAMALNPSDLNAWACLRNALVGLGKWETLEIACNVALSNNPPCLLYLEALAITRQQLGKWQSAVDAYEQALALKGNNADLQGQLGFCHYNLKQYAKAIPILEAAIAGAPAESAKVGDWTLLLGKALAMEEDWKRAGEVLATADHRKNIDAEGLVYLGTALVQAGDLDRAKVSLNRAAQLDPDNIWAWKGLGRVLDWQGKGDTPERAQVAIRVKDLEAAKGSNTSKKEINSVILPGTSA